MTDAFECAFVAVSYLLGQRDTLLTGLANPSDAARSVATLAVTPDQRERARRLAAELLPIVTAFEARRLT